MAGLFNLAMDQQNYDSNKKNQSKISALEKRVEKLEKQILILTKK